MTAPRIYTGAEASKLLSALCANRTPAPWHVGDRVLTDELNDVRVIQSADRDSVGHVWASAFDGDHDDIALAAAATLAAAAPDLAASVAHHAERADKAEAEVKSAVDRLVGLVGDRAPLADMIRAVEDGIRTMEVERDAANARADASGAVLRAAVEVFDGGETSPADLPAALGEYLRTNAAQVAPAMASDRQASETCADLRRQLLVVTAERDSLLASRIRWIDAAGAAAHTLCPTCGVGVSIDEAGCCETCGGDAMGSYVEERRECIEAAEAVDRAAGVAALDLPT